ncbi:MAG: M36 family metallopeptidase [Nocardioides sp.]
MRTRSLLALAAVSTLVAGSALTGPASVAKKHVPGHTTATATVFKVNPVQSSGDQTLTDQKDSASAVLPTDYAGVTLTRLDGSGNLSGDWVTIESSTGPLAFSSTGAFNYNRSQGQFEQVMAYYWITRAQDYVQSLGFGSTLPGVMDEQIAVKINQYGGDNSYQTTKPFRLRFGKGGVDDAEDAEVIVHEYGHAIHADQVPGYGTSLDAGAIGEGFGDYLAVTVGLEAAAENGWPVRTETSGELERGWEAAACVADWDATEYSQSPIAKCLRRLDQAFTLDDRQHQVHFDGMIWSAALWDIRADYVEQGLGTERWDRTLIDAQFDFAPDTSFQDAAKATYDRALAEDGPAAAQAVRDRFAERQIFFS